MTKSRVSSRRALRSGVLNGSVHSVPMGARYRRQATAPARTAQAGSASWTTSKLQIVDPVAAGRSESARPLACPCPAENDCERVHSSNASRVAQRV